MGPLTKIASGYLISPCSYWYVYIVFFPENKNISFSRATLGEMFLGVYWDLDYKQYTPYNLCGYVHKYVVLSIYRDKMMWSQVKSFLIILTKQGEYQNLT